MAKRGRRPSAERKGYFYEKEEQAVIDYNNAVTAAEKNEIFNTVLRPALVKMTESIIRRYKLFVPDEEFEENFDDTMSYLITKLDYYNPDKGCKAYSYCGTIIKNYLLYKKTQYDKNLQRNTSYEDMADDIKESARYVNETSNFTEAAPDIIKQMAKEIKKMTDNPDRYNLNANEIKVGLAMTDLFNNWEQILSDDGSNKLNKSSVLYFLREETMMDTPEIRNNMKKYKNVYKIVKKLALE